MTKMRFGIQTSLNNVEWREIEDMWKFLDRETKFDSAWTFDHFVPPGPGQDANANCFEGWTALAALASITERIRLGCLVTGVTYRHPSVLAKMAATVDHISNGRLSFGIGAAWHEPEHRMYGIDFPPVKERQDRLEESVHLIKLLFEAEGRVNFDGKYYHLNDAVFVPRCVQKPHPPIMVGGGGEKRTLRTLALYGDVMNVFGTPDVVRAKIAAIEAHCRAVGRDPAEIQRTISATVVVTRQPWPDRPARRHVRPGHGAEARRGEEAAADRPAGARAGGRRAVRRGGRQRHHHADAGPVEARDLPAHQR